MEEKDNRIVITDAEGGKIELYVLEETRIGGKNYILTTDAKEEEDGECYILRDVSAPEDSEAVYEFVEEDRELDYVFGIFSELMGDTETELIR